MQHPSQESPNSVRFEFQNWSVYQKALDFVVEAYKLCENLPATSANGLRDQLRRASQSVPLNIAEGCSRWSKKDKANFWRVAKGSVFECVALLDVIERLKLVEADFDTLQDGLVSIGKMLSGLIRFIEKEGESRNARAATPPIGYG